MHTHIINKSTTSKSQTKLHCIEHTHTTTGEVQSTSNQLPNQKYNNSHNIYWLLITVILNGHSVKDEAFNPMLSANQIQKENYSISTPICCNNITCYNTHNDVKGAASTRPNHYQITSKAQRPPDIFSKSSNLIILSISFEIILKTE